MSYLSRMTVKGQITVPKDIRNSLGLAPGEVAEFVKNAKGEIVLKRKKGGADAAKLAAIRQQIASVAGSFKIGKSTDTLMRELRGNDPVN